VVVSLGRDHIVKVVIDLDLCEGHAKCQESAPDVFEVNDDDQSTLKVADIPEYQYDRVRRAAQMCPRAAITLEE
jgi:ferredoxin